MFYEGDIITLKDEWINRSAGSPLADKIIKLLKREHHRVANERTPDAKVVVLDNGELHVNYYGELRNSKASSIFRLVCCKNRIAK